MRCIRKYPIGQTDFSHHFPVGAQILAVELQHGVPTMWVELDALGSEAAEAGESLKTIEWDFTVVATGSPVPDNARHIATYQQPPYVWHLYQRIGGESG